MDFTHSLTCHAALAMTLVVMLRHASRITHHVLRFTPAISGAYAGALKFGSQGLAHDRRGHTAGQALQVPECPLRPHCAPSGETGPNVRWLSGSPGQPGGRPRHHRRRCIQVRCPGLLRRVSTIWASYAPYLLKIAVTSSGEANSPLSAAAMPFWTSATNQA